LLHTAVSNNLSPWAFERARGEYPAQILLEAIRRALDGAMMSSLASFHPSIAGGITGFSALLLILLTFLCIPWLSQRLRQIPEPILVERRGLLRRVLWIYGVAALCFLVIHPLALRASFQSARAAAGESAAAAIDILFFLVVWVILQSALLGGLLGTLHERYAKPEEQRRGFLANSVLFLKPMLGLNLILVLAALVFGGGAYFRPVFSIVLWLFYLPGTPSWWHSVGNAVTEYWLFGQLVLSVFMLSPIVLVVGGLGGIEAFKRAAKDWLAHAWDMLSFIAVGISFIMFVTVAQRLPSLFVSKWSLAVMPIGLVVRLIGVLITGVMLVAVWKLYVKITEYDKSVSETVDQVHQE
jgi:hypothetical protein